MLHCGGNARLSSCWRCCCPFHACLPPPTRPRSFWPFPATHTLQTGPCWPAIVSRPVSRSRRTWVSATTSATPRWGCQTCWSTTPCRRPHSKQPPGFHSSTSSVILTASSFSARSLLRSVWSGRSIRADRSARRWRPDARARWRPTDFRGRPFWTATSSRSTTTCASHRSPTKKLMVSSGIL